MPRQPAGAQRKQRQSREARATKQQRERQRKAAHTIVKTLADLWGWKYLTEARIRFVKDLVAAEPKETVYEPKRKIHERAEEAARQQRERRAATKARWAAEAKRDPNLDPPELVTTEDTAGSGWSTVHVEPEGPRKRGENPGGEIYLLFKANRN